jgi:general stress protein CsbA
MNIISLLCGIFSHGENKSVSESQPDLSAALQHAKDSYTNLQSVIQFVDTKSSHLIAIMGISVAGLAAGPFWLVGSEGGSKCLSVLLSSNNEYWVILPWVFALLAGLCSIIFALLSVTAKKPDHVDACFGASTEDLTRGWPKHVALFPVSHPSEIKDVAKKVGLLSQGMSQKQIIREYERQLIVVGAILFSKITFHRYSALSLVVHLFLAGWFVIAFACSMISCN